MLIETKRLTLKFDIQPLIMDAGQINNVDLVSISNMPAKVEYFLSSQRG